MVRSKWMRLFVVLAPAPVMFVVVLLLLRWYLGTYTNLTNGRADTIALWIALGLTAAGAVYGAVSWYAGERDRVKRVRMRSLMNRSV